MAVVGAGGRNSARYSGGGRAGVRHTGPCSAVHQIGARKSCEHHLSLLDGDVGLVGARVIWEELASWGWRAVLRPAVGKLLSPASFLHKRGWGA